MYYMFIQVGLHDPMPKGVARTRHPNILIQKFGPQDLYGDVF